MAAVDEEHDRTRRRQVWLGVMAGLAVVVVLAVISLVSTRGSAPAPAAGTAAEATQRARLAAPRRVPGDPLAMGNVSAPVVIVEWADFQCPYCKAFNDNPLPTLIRQYVQTGKARLEWRDFAFLGPESTTAAIAARAAGRQGAFWAYHDLLYAQQHPENSGALTKPYLVGLAQQLGLNVAKFGADMADPTLATQVASDKAAGLAVGVNGTPTVLINGQLVDGADDLSTYQKDIDAALVHPAAAR